MDGQPQAKELAVKSMYLAVIAVMFYVWGIACAHLAFESQGVEPAASAANGK